MPVVLSSASDRQYGEGALEGAVRLALRANRSLGSELRRLLAVLSA
jgi:hypothetical protein